MKTKTLNCALPGQMTLEEIVDSQGHVLKNVAQKTRKVNEKNCRYALAERFGVMPGCVAIVDYCWCKDLLCVRAYIERVEYLVQYKGGFGDVTPKIFKVMD